MSLVSDVFVGLFRRKKRGNEEDIFGVDDEDWNFYREIKLDEDFDVLEEENVIIDVLEVRLLKYDMIFI